MRNASTLHHRLALGAALLALAMLRPAQAVDWVVGPNGSPMSFAQALARAGDGDTIDILPGEYRGEVASITQRRLTIRGVGERPVFAAAGQHAEGKAIWVVKDGDITVDNIEFRGARVPDANGAGIRFEKGRLTVRRCAFFDNENGLLTANFNDAELIIEDSEFGAAPSVVGGLHHLLYVGRIARLSVSGSRFHQGFEGHLIKSRARVNRLAYNLIVDGAAGGASYEIDLPNGGDAQLVGNIIGQGANTQNPVVVAYGGEGRAWDVNRLLLSHNTLVSDYPLAWFLRAWPEKLTPDTTMIPTTTGDRPIAPAASRRKRAASYARDRYSPVSVLIRTLSPWLTNGGTCTTSPVSSVAGLSCALAVAPLMAGVVSTTVRSTVCGSSIPTGSLP